MQNVLTVTNVKFVNSSKKYFVRFVLISITGLFRFRRILSVKSGKTNGFGLSVSKTRVANADILKS